MGILDKILGRDEEPGQGRSTSGTRPAGQLSDEQAVERYRYMLRTAPPEAVEQAHEEAFERLSPEQRRMVLAELSREAPAPESAAAGDDPRSLARLATRAEIRQPGTLERTFGRLGGGGMGLGGMMAGSFLGSIAGVVIGSAIAQSFFGGTDFGDHAAAGDRSPEVQDSDASQNAGDDFAADAGEDVDTDFGGDFGDF